MKTAIRIRSKSHRFDTNSFGLLNQLGSNFKVEIIDDSLFNLIWDVAESSEFFSEFHDHHCSVVFNTMLAALNIATYGLFTWHDGTQIGPIFIRGVTGDEKVVSFSQDHQQQYDRIDVFTEKNVHDALLLFGSLTREADGMVVVEYLKGVMHLSMSFYDINFHREAFGNFYRVIEYMVTNRILKKKKLNNEFAEIQKVYRNYGADETLIADFKAIYKKRGSQIMHAQLQPENISFDEALSTKIFCDILLRKYFINAANNWRSARKNA